jgi:hypothetical protein
MDNKAILDAVTQMQAGLDALATAVGGGEGAEASDTPEQAPEDTGAAPEAGADIQPPEMGPLAGAKAMSPEDFINKKAAPRQ